MVPQVKYEANPTPLYACGASQETALHCVMGAVGQNIWPNSIKPHS